MSDVAIASNREDAAAADQVVAHHAEMAGKLAMLVTAVTQASTGEEARAARDRLVAWARAELLPHAAAEERSLYRAGGELAELKVLVPAMLAEHRAIDELVETLARADTFGAIAGAAGGLREIVSVHIHKENEALLPALVASNAHSVADLLAEMHATSGASSPSAECDAHACACGHEEAAEPELDACAIPHAIRHATIFGALDTLQPGRSLTLLAPHDPVPLLAQLEQRNPGAFEVEYLRRGPDVWRLRFLRR